MATKLPDGTSITLKYLFEVEYQDGTTYVQNPEDQSVQVAERSCYFDVRQDQVKRFHLIGPKDRFTIDLTDGHFEVNGISFMNHEEDLENFRLMYHRIRDIHFDINMHYRGQHDVTYRIGWQANEKKTGKNYQRFMYVK